VILASREGLLGVVVFLTNLFPLDITAEFLIKQSDFTMASVLRSLISAFGW
jgi:hypothetical protein